MKFTKMHGIGNDYVYINAIENEVEDPSSLAKLVSDRHFGIGSDGLILIKASDRADFMMDMYNADGSRGKMCGNGIRCVGKYVYDHGLTSKKIVTVETLSGIKILNLAVKPDDEVEGYKEVSNNGMVVSHVTVNMGSPIFEPDEIPIKLTGAYKPENSHGAMVNIPIMIDDTFYYGTPVSMGNPHVIVYVDDTDSVRIEEIGPKFEKHEMFPEQVNTEFVQVVDRGHLKMRVWERGSGETLACGTGACATVVASIVNEKTEDEVTVSLLGGDLKIRWDQDQNNVFMTGPATTVFEGNI
ncbi:MAG TPA: diaminopimelate epimerase [Lachnospiraceae bacterium]|nr:diaminopimelate epimerase [Lachnospiraceae bacterium]